MLRLRLTTEERTAVQGLRRDRTLTPAERDRVEMVSLADAGWGAPRIAAHLGLNPVTVRRLLKRFPETGVAGLRRKPPGPPPDLSRRERVDAALAALLDRERTWTAAQLADALGEAGIALSPRQTRKERGRIAAWRRTVRSLRHKQDGQKVERAKAVLTALKKKPPVAASDSSTSTNAASAPASR
jgi:transposase